MWWPNQDLWLTLQCFIKPHTMFSKYHRQLEGSLQSEQGMRSGSKLLEANHVFPNLASNDSSMVWFDHRCLSLINHANTEFTCYSCTVVLVEDEDLTWHHVKNYFLIYYVNLIWLLRKCKKQSWYMSCPRLRWAKLILMHLEQGSFQSGWLFISCRYILPTLTVLYVNPRYVRMPGVWVCR